jgi:sugar (pentulose or hexulose) kinase
MTQEQEASSRGAAMLALLAAGELGSFSDVVEPPARPLQPDPDRHTVHVGAMERHRRLAQFHAW